MDPTHSWKAFYRAVWNVASAANALKVTLALMESKHASNTPGYHFSDYLAVKPSEEPGAIDELVANIRALRKAVHST